MASSSKAFDKLSDLAHPSPGVKVVQLPHELCQTFKLHISKRWLRASAKPRKIYTSLSPGVYQLAFALGHPDGLRTEVWRGVLDLQLVPMDEQAMLESWINFGCLDKYRQSHFTAGYLSIMMPVTLQENNVSNIYAAVTSTVSDLQDAPSSSMVQFSPNDSPLLVLVADDGVPLAHTVTPATHGRKSGHFKVRELKNILKDSKQALKFLPTPDQLQSNPTAKQVRNDQLFRGAPSVIPSEHDLPLEITEAIPSKAPGSQTTGPESAVFITKITADLKTPDLSSPVAPSAPCYQAPCPCKAGSDKKGTTAPGPLNSPAGGLKSPGADGSSFRSVLMTADLSMKLKSMEKETVLAWGSTVIVLLSIAVIARLILF